MDVYAEIIKLLDSHKVKYEASTHPAVKTSAEAASIRGVDIKTGAKAMVIRSEGKFYMFCLSASDKVDFKAVRRILGTDSVSLATPDEVLIVTHCVVGCVPPFGSTLFGIKTYVDRHLLPIPEINFSAGRLTHSVGVKTEDWHRIVEAEEEEYCSQAKH